MAKKDISCGYLSNSIIDRFDIYSPNIVLYESDSRTFYYKDGKSTIIIDYLNYEDDDCDVYHYDPLSTVYFASREDCGRTLTKIATIIKNDDDRYVATINIKNVTQMWGFDNFEDACQYCCQYAEIHDTHHNDKLILTNSEYEAINQSKSIDSLTIKHQSGKIIVQYKNKDFDVSTAKSIGNQYVYDKQSKKWSEVKCYTIDGIATI